jgi:hypothetical protein
MNIDFEDVTEDQLLNELFTAIRIRKQQIACDHDKCYEWYVDSVSFRYIRNKLACNLHELRYQGIGDTLMLLGYKINLVDSVKQHIRFVYVGL